MLPRHPYQIPLASIVHRVPKRRSSNRRVPTLAPAAGTRPAPAPCLAPPAPHRAHRSAARPRQLRPSGRHTTAPVLDGRGGVSRGGARRPRRPRRPRRRVDARTAPEPADASRGAGRGRVSVVCRRAPTCTARRHRRHRRRVRRGPVLRTGGEKVRLLVLLILPHLRYIFLESLGGNDPKPKTTFLGVPRESVWSSTPSVSRKVFLK